MPAIFQSARLKESLIAVFSVACVATKLPTPKTNSMKKNVMENN